MTTTLQAPPRTPPPPPAPPHEPRSRRWLLGFWAAAFLAFLAAAPGRTTFETKLGVALDPLQFISDLGELWHSRAGFGGIFDQYIGYAFPMLPFYALADLLHVPVWLAERLWLSIVVTTAFWGALRLAERLRFGSPATRLLGAAAYALWPTYTIVIGSTSAAALPGALLPWVLLPLTNPHTTPRIAALRSALLIPCMGGVNAASTLAALLPVGLYLLSRPATPRRRALIAWWVPGVLLATAWWVVPLLLLGIHGENFLPYVEQAETTTATMSATELLRGAGNWTAYLHFGEAWLPAGWTVATSALTVLGSALAAALGLAGLARRDIPERRWLLLTTLAIATITLAGYGGSLGGPFHSTVQDWLNGPLVPFRNIYKFQPGLALALALGLTHVTSAIRPRASRLAPPLTALLILPALALPYLNGTILQPGSFTKLPTHWQATADWLKKYSPDSRALVVPATAHGIYTWGSTIDQPLDVLAKSRWAQRDYVPFGTPGNRRAMDAVEQALTTGAEVPGLSDYLSRAGLHYVVVRNDLDPDQMGYVPPQTVKRTLEESGYRRTTGFGPVLTGGRIPDDTPVQVEGLYPRQQAVEIYEPPSTKRPGRADITPVADAAIISGGPESLLRLSADPTMRRRPAVLTGDSHPGLGDPAIQATSDGLRRADTRFGLVNSNTSYTYTATEKNHTESLQDPGRAPRQILPTNNVKHQTTAVLRGAESVTASSSGNWLFHLPQYDPVNAFDGNPDTAWAEGSAAEPKGEWLRIAFTSSVTMPSQIRVTPLPSDGVRAAPTSVRVETDSGTRTSPLHPNGTPQNINTPPGKATYLKLTITSAQQGRPGLMGAGFTGIDIPGVQVTRLLSLPQDADPDLISLHRGSDPGGLSPVSAEVGLHRQFSTATQGTYALTATALPVPGDELDQLLYSLAPDQRRSLTATADSTARLGASLTPRNLVDGDLTTAWIAGNNPTIHLRWPGKRPIGEIVFAPAGGLSTRPEQVEISSPDGATTASVDENGLARFEPINTNSLDIKITRSSPLTVHNPVADARMQLPVGLSEVYVPALDEFRVPQPEPTRTFELPCGKGPILSIDGTLHATSAKGKLSDLTERRPIDVSLCAGPQRNGKASLPAGTHRVEAGDAGPLALTDITLTRNKPAPPAKQSRDLTIQDAAGDRRSLTVGPGEASYLQTYENANAGWQATLNGKKLPSLRLDGWQQGWLIPEGAGGEVRMEYKPARLYEAGLIAGGIALLTLAAATLYRRKETTTPTHTFPPQPGPILGLAALTLTLALTAGPLALLVPLLALLAHFRPTLLPPLALFTMTAAGTAAALQAGAPAAASQGAFGPAAQLLALTALTAALVTTPARRTSVPGGDVQGRSPQGVERNPRERGGTYPNVRRPKRRPSAAPTPKPPAPGTPDTGAPAQETATARRTESGAAARSPGGPHGPTGASAANQNSRPSAAPTPKPPAPRTPGPGAPAQEAATARRTESGADARSPGGPHGPTGASAANQNSRPTTAPTPKPPAPGTPDTGAPAQEGAPASRTGRPGAAPTPTPAPPEAPDTGRPPDQEAAPGEERPS